MANNITNSQEIIDSRDVVARIDELQDIRDDLQLAVDEAQVTENAREAQNDLTEWDGDDEGQELKALKALADEGERFSEWKYGAVLIREDYFVEYCEEMTKDIGDMPPEIPGYIVIDWDATAENLKADYSTIDFDGVEYYIRNC